MQYFQTVNVTLHLRGLIQLVSVLFVQMQTWVLGLHWKTLQSMLSQLNLLGLTQNSHTIQARRTFRTGNNERAYYNIEQFANFRIEQVSTATDSAETFDSTTNKFDSNTVAFDGNDIRIPQAAFTTRINVSQARYKSLVLQEQMHLIITSSHSIQLLKPLMKLVSPH